MSLKPWRGAVIGCGGGATLTTSTLRGWSASRRQRADDLVGVEAEVERVVAQEAPRVDGRGKVIHVATLERDEMAGADLRLAFSPDQIDALALSRGLEDLSDLRSPLGLDRPRLGGRRSRSVRTCWRAVIRR